MVRYYFDIHDGIDLRDEAGTALPDIEAARAHAISRASHYVSDLDGDGRGGFIVVTIRDRRRRGRRRSDTRAKSRAPAPPRCPATPCPP
ncbi:MAG: hypothetical protein EOP89_16640, partial [Lysobacteraceae bacterium]